MLGAGQVQRFIAGDQADNFGVAFHQFAFGKGEGAGEADVEADRFQGINAHQAQIEFLFSSRRFTVTVLPLTVWVPSPSRCQ